MAKSRFRTVADDLLHVANAVADHMSSLGFKVLIEHQELGFPHCPTLLCKRGHTTVVVEVVATIVPDRMNTWRGYGKSCSRDFRLCFAIPVEAGGGAVDRNRLQDGGVGLLEVDNQNCEERLAPLDLSINVELPALRSQPGRVRELLGIAYEGFDRGNWREGFEAAAQAIEAEARRYLKRHMRSGRIVFVGRPVTRQAVDRMTLGGLAATFARIQNQNHADAQIGEALDAINKDRIGVVHHRGRKVAEKRLRDNVGRHMWTIVAVMKHAVT